MFHYIATILITFADKIGGEAYTQNVYANKAIPRNEFGCYLNEQSQEYKNAVEVIKENYRNPEKNIVITVTIQEIFQLGDINV